MPCINKDFLTTLQDDYTKYLCFIESGTHNGATIFSIEPHFDKLITIEYSEKYYNRTKNKYTGNKINFILGDSSIVFETLLPTISDKCIFFLDGHWSGGDTGHSTKDCPLNEEITHKIKCSNFYSIYAQAGSSGSCTYFRRYFYKFYIFHTIVIESILR
jgi:hypothetical protein